MALQCRQFPWSISRILNNISGSVYPLHLQVRYKVRQGSRLKAPSLAAAKEKWVPRKKKYADTSVTKQATAAFLAKEPTDDVWIHKFYPEKTFELDETLKNHKEFAQPSMLDNMDGFVYAEFELDLTSKKKTRSLSAINNVILLPHLFDYDPPKKCVVFCTKEEDQALATEMGALFVGDEDLVTRIKDGGIDRSEFDAVLSTPDMIINLVPIRTIIKDVFPMKAKGNVGPNVKDMMLLYTKGLTLQSQKIGQGEGRLQVPLGMMNMSDEQLLENFRKIATTISAHRPANLGPIIKSVSIIAPPSTEKFLLTLNDQIPGYEVDREVDSDSDDEEEDNQTTPESLKDVIANTAARSK